MSLSRHSADGWRSAVCGGEIFYLVSGDAILVLTSSKVEDTHLSFGLAFLIVAYLLRAIVGFVMIKF